MSSNFNGNAQNLDAIMNLIRYPKKAAKTQLEFNQKRINKFEKALSSRPVFIPLTFDVPFNGSNSTIDVPTPLLPYEYTITGAITDAPVDRQISITVASAKDNPFVIVGKNRSLKMRLSDFAGGSAFAAAGQKQVFYFPTPIRLARNVRLEFSMYKPETTDTGEKITLVLIGHRTKETSEIADEQKALFEQYLNLRTQPRNKFIKQLVEFDSSAINGLAENVYFPDTDEPLIIKGCRADLKHSLITSIKIQGEENWNTAPLPIWALAANKENTNDNYIWFQRPVLLPANGLISMDLKNSINGVNIDAQFDNELTWITQTI